MREWYRDRSTSRVLDLGRAPDKPIERLRAQKAIDREPSNRYDHPRPDHRELVVEPGRTKLALSRRRQSVPATTGTGSGIAARNRCDVDMLASSRFVEPDVPQPAEQRAAGTTGEWPSADRFHTAGGLPHEHDLRRARRGHDWKHIAGVTAPAAGGERLRVSIEEHRE
jgi:hypothetical protein